MQMLAYVYSEKSIQRCIKMSQPISRVLSWTIIYLGCLSPSNSCNLPELSAGHTMEFLFGLAPSGVCHAVIVANYAVRSYRTFSPLLLNIKIAVYFLW